MKITTKASKRIFCLFLAVLCTLGVFFVSYIDSFAVDYITVPVVSVYTVAGLRSSGATICANNSGTSIFVGSKTSNSYFVGCYQYNSTSIYYYVYSATNSNDFRWCYSNDSNVRSIGSNQISLISTGVYRYFISNFNNTYITTLEVFPTLSDLDDYMINLINPPVTPTPTPTPTPAPVTPTPDPGGSIPTPSGDYGSFFQRMASDAQSAFNALYLSWTNANNRFYSSIFFIGLPLLITVFCIVAGIILGDDD